MMFPGGLFGPIPGKVIDAAQYVHPRITRRLAKKLTFAEIVWTAGRKGRTS